MHARILVALLPVPPKNPESNEIHRIWHTVISKVLNSIQEVDLDGPGYAWDCPNGQVHRCYSIVAAWIADYIEYIVVMRLIGGFCPVCEILKDAMGHVSSVLWTDFAYPRRDKFRYHGALESSRPQSLKEHRL